MAVYFGVVKGTRVELEGDVQIAEGARVEVRPVDSPARTTEAEQAVVRDLLAAGLLDEMPTGELAPEEPFVPVVARGRPLSEQIIEERR